MKVLHYIHRRLSGDLLSDTVMRTIATLDGIADTDIITRADDYQPALDNHTPDIVHIHGCWDRYAYRLMKAAQRQGYAVVLSPHGELGTYAMRREQRIAKWWKLTDYQRWMTANCEAILVTRNDERDELLRLGWQKRIDVVGNPLLDSTLTDAETGAALARFYQKVTDTRYHVLMTREEKEAVRSMLHAGMAGDEKWALISSDQLLTLRDIKPVQWRRILLYADDEDIRAIIASAVTRLQLSIPDIDTGKIERFPNDFPKAKGALEPLRVLGRNRIRARKIKEETAEDPRELKELTVMLANAWHLVRKRRMSLRQLAELYGRIKYSDYDESRFTEITKDLRLHTFMRRMLQVMADDLQLEEGFMPDAPKDDRTTRLIRQLFVS